MKKHSEPSEDWDVLREKIIGLGERSVRKSYYPELLHRYAELNRFRQLLDQSSELILVFDVTNLRVVDANDTACEILGRDRKNLLETDLSELHSVFGETVLKAIAEPGHSIPVRAEVTRPDDTVRTLDGWAKVVTTDDQPTGMLVARDISERVRAEEALQQSEIKYRHLYESMRDAFSSCSMAGYLQEFNHAFQAMVGYSAEELRQLSYRDLTPEKWHAFEASIIEKQVLGLGYSDVYEKEYRRKDGTVFPVELRTFLLRDAANRPTGMWAIVRDITERKEAGKALQASETRFRDLSAMASDWFWEQDDQFRFTYISVTETMSTLAQLGVSYTELLGKARWELPINLTPAQWAAHRALLEAHQPFRDFEYQMRVKSSADRWFNINGKPLFDDAGRFIGYRGTGRDITDRKQVEAALRESERLFRAVFEQAPHFIGILDLEGNVLKVNVTATDFARIRPEDVYGKPFWETPWWQHSQEEQERLRNAIRRVAQGELIHFETTHPAQGGELHAVDFTLKPVRDETGKVVVLVPEGRDITERKRAEAQLRENSNFLNTLLNAIPVPVFYKDAVGRYIGFNEAFTEFYGKKRQELVGKSVFDLAPKELAEIYHAKDLEVFQHPVPQVYESRVIDARGVAHDVVFHRAAFVDSNHHVRGLIGVILDITDRKRVEEELQRHREHLEELVAERTAELRQAMAQLVQTEKLAALGSLVAGVAHELNTPLGNARVVAGSLGEHLREFAAAVESGTLRRSHLDAFLGRSQEAVDLLERNTARAADLIGHFKQVAVDQTSARRRRFDLRQTVEELLLTLQPQFKHTAHRVELDIPPGIELDSYPGPLEQVFANLIDNSLTHGFAGVETGRIQLQAQVVDPTRVALRYADDGTGIPTAILNRIFEPFFTTRLGQGGSGLGLYIVYNLVTAMLGGTIQAQSWPGQGTTFTLVLPRTAPDH
ncbi:MAG: PAS domain S-box protein [Candidatus Contendobacter sp.]|nr:PAS domain S-box protein [Candidatus Contendobacter sp.]